MLATGCLLELSVMFLPVPKTYLTMNVEKEKMQNEAIIKVEAVLYTVCQQAIPVKNVNLGKKQLIHGHVL